MRQGQGERPEVLTHKDIWKRKIERMRIKILRNNGE